MESNIKLVGLTERQEPCWVPTTLENLRFPNYCVMAIDGSSSNTGVSILQEGTGAIMASCAFSRSKHETPVEYKVALKRTLRTIMLQNTNMRHTYYEEPFIGFTESTKVLFMLRTCIAEVIAENAPVLDRVRCIEVNNQKWKKLFLAPDKCPQGSDNQKKAVRARMVSYLPFMDSLTEDEIDAASMGFVCVSKLKAGLELDLETQKKTRPFTYEIRFIGADNDEDMFDDLLECLPEFDVPRKLYEDGIKFAEVDGRGKFENKIFSHMGSDDALLVIKFDSSKNGDVILAHRIGHLAAEYAYIYAAVWRKNRKK